jgi:hypothetical protein
VYCQAVAITGMRISGKNVGGGAQRRQRADDQEQQRYHDEGVGPLQGDADQTQHHWIGFHFNRLSCRLFG